MHHTAKRMTPKQAAFVDEYMIDHNATAAAKRAGYSAHTARQQAAELMATDCIQQAINAAELNVQRRNAITVDDLLIELEEARQQAKAEGKSSAMVSATMAKAKILGFDKPQPVQPEQETHTIRVVFGDGSDSTE
jgi:phage terminase small subunit